MNPAPFIVYQDSREQRPPTFPKDVLIKVRGLSEGDYSCPQLLGIAAIERKSVPDWAGSITNGRARFERELSRLRPYRWKAIVVEGDLIDILRHTNAHEHAVLGSIASFTARYDCPVILAGNLIGDRSHVGYLISGLLRRWAERVEDEARERAASEGQTSESDKCVDAIGMPVARDACPWCNFSMCGVCGGPIMRKYDGISACDHCLARAKEVR